MPDASTKEAMTNTTPKSRCEVNCDCNTMWSLAQQFGTKRLCAETGEHKGELIQDYSVRARRIAATYARFYLELEDGGDPEKVGRYYWMALGAFASKTIACTFEAWQVRMMSLGENTVREGLGKGNLWLFFDMSGWHWYYNKYPESFGRCIDERDANKYVVAVKRQMEALPWRSGALKTIKYFAPSAEIKQGFESIGEFERSKNETTKLRLQLVHLLAVIKHEQGVILQPLIYEDAAFATWVERQRAWYAHWASPALELVFTHECSSKHLEVKSVAHDDIQLENFTSRMEWIKNAATKFHNLMQKRFEFMNSALTIIAGWVDLKDSQTSEHSNAL